MVFIERDRKQVDSHQSLITFDQDHMLWGYKESKR